MCCEKAHSLRDRMLLVWLSTPKAQSLCVCCHGAGTLLNRAGDDTWPGKLAPQAVQMYHGMFPHSEHARLTKDVPEMCFLIRYMYYLMYNV